MCEAYTSICAEHAVVCVCVYAVLSYTQMYTIVSTQYMHMCSYAYIICSNTCTCLQICVKCVYYLLHKLTGCGFGKKVESLQSSGMQSLVHLVKHCVGHIHTAADCNSKILALCAGFTSIRFLHRTCSS